MTWLGLKGCKIYLTYGIKDQISSYIYNLEESSKSRKVILNTLELINKGLNDSLSSFINVSFTELYINKLTISKQKLPENMVLFSIKFSKCMLKYIVIM